MGDEKEVKSEETYLSPIATPLLSGKMRKHLEKLLKKAHIGITTLRTQKFAEIRKITMVKFHTRIVL